ncbi:MAG: glycosyltransferase [Pirellulaceae bacterium]
MASIHRRFALVSEAEKLRQRRRLGLTPNRPLGIFVGDWPRRSQGSVGCLIAAWQKLCRLPNFHGDLLVLGSGPKLNCFQRQVAAAGLQHRIRLLGYQRNVAEWLAAADVLVAPTKYEACGRKVCTKLCAAGAGGGVCLCGGGRALFGRIATAAA